MTTATLSSRSSLKCNDPIWHIRTREFPLTVQSPSICTFYDIRYDIDWDQTRYHWRLGQAFTHVTELSGLFQIGDTIHYGPGSGWETRERLRL
jgi:hypothetical protein